MIDLRYFCNPDKPHCALPCRVDDWVVASDGFCMVGVRRHESQAVAEGNSAPHWLQEAGERPATGDLFAAEFRKQLDRSRQYKMRLGDLRAWALEGDVEGYRVELVMRDVAKGGGACEHCGGRIVAEAQRIYDNAKQGPPTEVLIDRTLVRRCLFPLRRRDNDWVEIGLGHALDAVVMAVMRQDRCEPHTFIAVMPLNHGEADDDALNLSRHKNRAALGFE